MNDIPEIIPRITQDQIPKAPNVGLAQQLRQKFRFLLVIGVFGRGATLHTICRRMYVTTTFTEKKLNKKTGESELVETVNDVSAYDRIDNICRGDKKPVIEAELEFLRRCFERVFGNNAMAAISDDLLLKGSMFQILTSLPGTTTEFNWSDIDPILSLQAISVAEDGEPWFEIERSEGRRWTQQSGGVTPILTEGGVEVLPTGSGYRLFLDAEIARERPFVFEFLDEGEGKTEDGRSVRAQLLPLPKRSDDGEGPWRIAGRLNRPLEMGQTEGRFGFCAISGLGLAIEDLFPVGFDPLCITDADLRMLAGQVLEHATRASPPLIGIHRYVLITPDAKGTPPRNRGA